MRGSATVKAPTSSSRSNSSTFAIGILGDLLSGQRTMLQRIFERVRRLELHSDIPPSHYEPGATPTGQPPTTGANAGKTEEREAIKL